MNPERKVPEWHGRETAELSERRTGTHGHIYYNRGGSYRGYETRTDDCHKPGVVVKLCFADFVEETGRVAKGLDAEWDKATHILADERR